MTSEETLPPPNLFTLSLLLSLGSLSAVILTPSIPAIEQFFSLNAKEAIFIMTFYLFGYAFGQLIYGPVANKIKIKPSLYLGISLFIISNLFCLASFFTKSYVMLWFFRIFMGLGAGVGYNLTFTIINHYYEVEKSRKIIPLVALGLVVYPLIAITFGGIIDHYLGWPFNFGFLILYGLFVLVMTFFLHVKEGPEEEKSGSSLAGYKQLFLALRVPTFSFIVGLCVSIFYLYSSIAPILAIEKAALTSAEYGYLSLIPSAGLLIGNLTARSITHLLSAVQVIILGIAIALPSAIGMLLLFFFGVINFFSLFLLVMLIYFGMVLAWSNATVLATKGALNKALAASLMSFFNVGFALVSLIIIGFFPIRNPLTLPISLAVALVLMIALLLFARKKAILH